MEIYFNDIVIDKFDVEIPGLHVKSLTSASRLIKEYKFQNVQQKQVNEIDTEYPANLDPKKEEDVKIAKTDPEKLKALTNKEVLLKKAIDGTLFVKAEWDGEGA